MSIWNYVRGAVALALSVGLLPTTSEAISVTVDCTTETIAAALDDGAMDIDPDIITVNGTCTENVEIKLDDVTIQGDGNDTVVGQLSIYAARRIKIQDLTITGGPEHGITAANGASFTALRLLIHDVPGAGVILTANSSGLVDQVTIHGATFGVTAGSNSHVDVINNSVIEEISANGAEAFDGGSTVLDHVTIQGANTGIFAGGNAYLAVSASTIQDNLDAGILLHRGADALLTGSTIQNNGGIGLVVDTNCSAIGDDLTIVGNTGNGVDVNQGSSATISNSTIENSGGVGVQLNRGTADISGTTIRDNKGGAGISVFLDSSLALHGSTIEGSTEGVSVNEHSEAWLTDNTISNNDAAEGALVVIRNSSVQLRGANVITSPGYALWEALGSTVLVREDATMTGVVLVDLLSAADFRNVAITGKVEVSDHSVVRMRNQAGSNHVTIKGNVRVSRDSGINFIKDSGEYRVKVIGNVTCADGESSLGSSSSTLVATGNVNCTGY